MGKEKEVFEMSKEEVLTFLDTNENGLSSEEVKKRQEKYGLNKLQEEKKKPFIVKFLLQLVEPMVIVLLIAGVISLAIHIVKISTNQESEELIDAIVIFAIVIINALIGSIQEQKAEQSLDALKKLSTPMCYVKRDGKIVSVKSEELVPGDIVVLEEGNIVPADIRLISSVDLKSDESSLTGESVPVEKDALARCTSETPIAERSNFVHMSCPISYGRGVGVVVFTGMESEIGKIAKMLEGGSKDETPLQKKLSKLSKQIGLICLGVVIITFLSGLIWILIDQEDVGFSILKLFEQSIALAVAAIPEGLSAVVTIALSLGVNKMVKVNTIVRKLPSVETLGSVTVVCSDKTGTLTQNKMTVKKVYLNNNIYDADQIDFKLVNFLATGMMLCSNASINGDRYGDPTELALLDYAKIFNVDKEETEKVQTRLDELPFDSVRKMMSTKNKYQGKEIVYTKGALDSILKNVKFIEINNKVRPITKADIENINRASNELASNAYRVLAFAYHYHKGDKRIKEEDLIYVGMVGMIDPERKEAKGSVLSLKSASIRTIMITGDHVDTAFAIAKNLNIASKKEECIMGSELDKLTFDELKEKVKTINVFARVSPTNKVQIVKALKANNNIVSMTGDGVNDAPSLKEADIGISMGITGTDVARSASDIVLTDDNFSSIEKAVKEGRGIFANIKKTIFYLLSSNFGEVLIMFFASILRLSVPLETLHILWINLITDSLPAIALSMTNASNDVMKQKPKNPKDGIFANHGFSFCLIYGVIVFLITFVAYLIPGLKAYNGGGYSAFTNLYKDETIYREASTFAFTVLALSQLFHMLGMVNLDKSVIKVYKEKNYMLYISFAVGLILQILVTEVPFLNTVFKTEQLHITEWLYLLPLAIVPLLAHEIMVPLVKKKWVNLI